MHFHPVFSILGLSVILFSGCVAMHGDTNTLLQKSKKTRFKPAQQLYYNSAVNKSYSEIGESAEYHRFMLFSQDIRTDDVLAHLEKDGRRLYARGYFRDRLFVVRYVRILMMSGVQEEAQIIIRHYKISREELLL